MPQQAHVETLFWADRRAVRWPAFLLAALVLALALGLGYGDDRSNQAVYLIDGIRMADPAVLAQDWWAAQTTHYHVAFSWLVAAVCQAGLFPWALNVLAVLLTVASLAAVWGMLRALDVGYDLPAALVAGGIFFGLYQATGAASIVYGTAGLQPATVAAAFLLVAAWMYLRGSYLLSGLWLAAAGGFHVNVAILALPAFGLAHLLLGRAALPHRLAAQLAAPLLVLLAQVPMIWRVSGYDLPPETRAAATSLLFQMLPHHYLPATFPAQLLDALGWLLLALPFLPCVGAGAPNRRLQALVVALAALLVAAALLTTAVFVPTVARLLAWRLAPLLTLLCQLAAVAAPLALLAHGEIRGLRWRLPVLWTGAALLLLFARPVGLADAPAAHVAFDMLILLLATAITLVAARPGLRDALARRIGTARGRAAVLGAGVLFALLAAGAGGFARDSFDLVTARPELAAERALYDWARTTPPDSRFLVPPNLQRFRLLARRAVVVDAKAIPMRPDEMLEWHRRLTAISPRRDPAQLGRFGYEAGYAELTPARIAELAGSYGADFAVFGKSSPVPAVAAPVAYENAGFVAFDLRPARR